MSSQSVSNYPPQWAIALQILGTHYTEHLPLRRTKPCRPYQKHGSGQDQEVVESTKGTEGRNAGARLLPRKSMSDLDGGQPAQSGTVHLGAGATDCSIIPVWHDSVSTSRAPGPPLRPFPSHPPSTGAIRPTAARSRRNLAQQLPLCNAVPSPCAQSAGGIPYEGRFAVRPDTTR